MRLLKLLLCTGMCLSLCACAPNKIKKNDTQSSALEEDVDYHTYVVDGKEYSYNSHLMNFLITGVDSEDTESGQSDFVLVLSFDRENSNYRILQLDRGAMVPIRMYDQERNFLGWKESYLALSYTYGQGTKQSTLFTKDAVSKLLHSIPITYYMTLSVQDLSMIQNVIGDMEVKIVDELAQNINPEWTVGSTALITAENVEQFLRFRDINMSGTNEMRMERQKEYMNTYLSALKNLIDSDFNTALNRVSEVADKVYTNVELGEISDILDMVTDYTFDDIYQLPGEVKQGMIRDYFEIDYESLDDLIVSLYYVE